MKTGLDELHLVLWNRALEVGPRVLVVLLFLVVGILAARAAGRAGRWLMERIGMDVLMERVGVSRLLYALGTRRSPSAIAGSLFSLAVLLATVGLIADVAELEGVASAVALVLTWLPRLVAALAIAAGGALAADALGAAARRAGDRRSDLVAPDLVGRIVHVAVLAVALTVAAEHLGLDLGLVRDLLLVVGGVALGSAGLAFALGSGPVFRNLVARPYVERLVAEGDRVRVAGERGLVEGVVVRVGATGVWLRGEEDGLPVTVTIPHRRLVDGEVRVIELDDAEGLAGEE